MNDEQYLLANAYVDGELTDDERRIAEADPDVMSEVEEIRALHAELASVEPPSSAARESAIAAAMAEFGQGATTATPTAPVVPHRPRPAMARYLGIAAAVVAVGLLGVVVATNGLGGRDDDNSSAEVATDAAASTAEAAPGLTENDIARTEAADAGSEFGDGAADEATAEMTMEAAEEAAESEEMAEMAEEAPAAADAATDADDAIAEEALDAEAGASEPVAGAVVRPDFDPDDFITNPVELGVYGGILLERTALGELGATPNTSCPTDFNILAATDLLRDDVRTPIFVAVQLVDAVVIALDQDSCMPLLEGPLLTATP